MTEFETEPKNAIANSFLLSENSKFTHLVNLTL